MILDDVLAEVRKTILADAPILGKSVTAFEQSFAEYLGAACAIGVNSGTDALILGMRALGIGPGDEVITQANTFFATVTAIEMVGAKPVLVDCLSTGPEIDTEQLRCAINPRTRAVIVVHMHGHATPLTEIKELCTEHDLLLLEDCAQAHGARHDGGKHVGSQSALSAFSFHPSKNLGAFGDAGAIATSDQEVCDLLRELRNLGKCGKFDAHHVAPNSKLDSIQATILQYKLPLLDNHNQRRRELAAIYHQALNEVEGLSLPKPTEGTECVYHHFVVLTTKRDALRQALAEQGIKTSLHYPTALHRQPGFLHLGYPSGAFPQAELRASHGLSLPLSQELSSEEITEVAHAVRLFFTGAAR